MRNTVLHTGIPAGNKMKSFPFRELGSEQRGRQQSKTQMSKLIGSMSNCCEDGKISAVEGDRILGEGPVGSLTPL